MKIKERMHVDSGLGGGYWKVRTVEVTAAPDGATVVPDETPVSDWTRDENQEA